MKRGHWLLLVALLVVAWQALHRHPHVGATSVATPNVSTTPIAAEAAPTQSTAYPREVAQTLALIQGGGPFPYDRDGVAFGNFEHHLPDRPRGYYHEYTVPTPGAHNRGARRIITGGQPPSEYWYTGDHYDSFSRLAPGATR